MTYFTLILLYLTSLSLIGGAIWRGYQTQGFSFFLIFSLLYAITFYAGFPLSLALHFGFGTELPALEHQFTAFLYGLMGYAIFYISYHWRLQAGKNPPKFANKQAKVTACLLIFIGLVSLIWFLGLNGFLLFRLEKYSQIFSNQVQGVYLKRFFYFFLVGSLLLYLSNPSRKNWWIFGLVGVVFGAVSYMAVGGTRANLALAVAFFLMIGLWHHYLRLRTVFIISLLGVLAMFALALARYKLEVTGAEAVYTFLYLTRDTFSPWENLAKVLSYPLEFQGLMPIVRDFYVYIPQSLWSDRPDIAWNTANYFTKIVLGNQSGLAMSPTLLGAFYIMGGWPYIVGGMVAVGFFVRGLDWIFQRGILCQAYCLANLFNLMVLVREGADAFVSRWVFLSLVFGISWGVSKCLKR
ncbi:enterobacterial common antigen polymerase [Pasteurellaceae bacterium RH1A]|nr:enterobacterial common antigen polymerase [Pasteurellaceae bacterium RH1A]